MTLSPPDYCRSCGTPLQSLDQPNAFYCRSCDGLVFHDPKPNARAVVVDDDHVLLVEIADEARVKGPPADDVSEWMTPGGHLHDVTEQPHEAAARELEEETGLTVAPEDLVLFDAVNREVVPGAHSLVLFYAVDRAATTGTLTADDDAADARFWRPAELAAADAFFRDLHAEPENHGDLDWLHRQATTALDGW